MVGWEGQGAPLGKVIQFDPSTGRSQILAKKLWFPRGVALSPNEDYLLISEAFGAPSPSPLFAAS